MNFKDYSPEDLRALSRRAGLASGEARRAKAAAIKQERIKNAAMRQQEERNRQQHLENIRTIRVLCEFLLEGNKDLLRGARYGW